MPGLNPLTVIKRNPRGEETFRYTGVILRQEPGLTVIEAFFNRNDLPFMGTVLRQGDRFIEAYFMDRWFNIFEIHDKDDDRIKGWYCNVCLPPILEAPDCLSYIDLALDLWVAPDGMMTVLDEDEFAALDLDQNTREKARQALSELKVIFKKKFIPG